MTRKLLQAICVVLLLPVMLSAVTVSAPSEHVIAMGDYVAPALTPSDVPLNEVQDSERVLIPWKDRVVETPELVVPATVEEWKAERAYLKALVIDTLGAVPARPETVSSAVVESGETETYTYEKVELDNGYGDIVPGTIYIPKGLEGKAPAILYLHYHGKEFETGQNELLYSWPFPEGTQLIDFFIDRGYIVFAIDAYAFLTRSGQGPGVDSDTGEKEIGLEEEASLYKYFTVQGIANLGMIIRDDMIALDYLSSRPEVDADRIGATGMSMGGTRTNWLMALDNRVKVGVSVACLTRMQDFIDTGNIVWHAFFNWVPGMLQRFDTETVVSLIAPRPYMQLMGTVDIGSPVEGVKYIEGKMREVYSLYGADSDVEFHYYDGVGHDYLTEEWFLMLDFFDEHLKNAEPVSAADITEDEVIALIADNPSDTSYYGLLDSSVARLFINGAEYDPSVVYVSNGSAMIPLSMIEKAGGEIALSSDGRSADVSYLSVDSAVSADSNLAIDPLTGETANLSKACEMKNGELCVPLSFLSDVLGLNCYISGSLVAIFS